MTQTPGLTDVSDTDFSHTEYCMGTAFTFKGRSPLSTAETKAAMDVACQILHAADETFSLYKPESPLSQLARGETSVAKCPPVVSDIWDACEEWEKTTDGWFSPFTPEHTFDPSGLVKTWAADQAAKSLLAAGIQDFTLNAGGDIWLSDELTDPLDWRVAIHQPVSIVDSAAGVLTVLDLAGTPFRAVATSGSAERGQHIWNPKAPGKEPANELVQVSVVARDLVSADVWATAAFAQGNRAIDLINAYNLRNPQTSIQVLAIDQSGDLSATEGFMDLFAKGDQQESR